MTDPAATMPAGTTPPPVTRIQPSHGWVNLGLRELWPYRELLWFLTMRNIKARYRQMALGPLWIVIQPVIDMVVFTVIFGRLAGLGPDTVPYPIFVYTALLPWSYFAQSANSSVSSLVASMPVISKVYFPRLVIPISAVMAGLVDLVARVSVLAGLVIFYLARGVELEITWRLLTLPVFVLMAMVTGLAVGLWGSTLAVRYRDLRFAVRNGVEIWKYLTPVVYVVTKVSDKLSPGMFTLYKLNPMFWVIEGFRWAVYGEGTAPEPLMAASAAILAVFLVTGMLVFRRTERNVVDLL